MRFVIAPLFLTLSLALNDTSVFKWLFKDEKKFNRVSERLFKGIDLNKNGIIEERELELALNSTSRRRVLPPEAVEDVKSMNAAKLDLAGFRSVLRQRTADVPYSQLEQFLSAEHSKWDEGAKKLIDDVCKTKDGNSFECRDKRMMMLSNNAAGLPQVEMQASDGGVKQRKSAQAGLVAGMTIVSAILLGMSLVALISALSIVGLLPFFFYATFALFLLSLFGMVLLFIKNKNYIARYENGAV